MDNFKQKYQQQLQDPRWKERRLVILRRDNYTCKICEIKDVTLNVHHHRYAPERDAWDYPDDELETLCESCHHTYHQLQNTIFKGPKNRRDEFFLKLLGNEIYSARKEYLGFTFITDPKNISGCIIVHNTTGLWSLFNIDVNTAHQMLVDDPDSVRELREMIVHAKPRDGT